jgi:hypothetical protein
MVTTVVIFNLLVSLICLFVAWRVWKLRLALAAAADVLASVERSTYSVLHGAPRGIINGQIGTRGLRERYQGLEPQLQKLQQVLQLLGLAQTVLRRSQISKRLGLKPRRRAR